MKSPLPAQALALLLGAVSCATNDAGSAVSRLALATQKTTASVPAPQEASSNQAKDKKDDEKDEDATKARPALKDYNLGKKDLALEGYDPVAYFPDFQGKATKGDKKISYSYRGVLYRFSSEANKKAFVANPTRFEPMYGGWCAWAMSDGKGDEVKISPKSFTIEDGRHYLFYDGFWGDTKKSWNKKGGAPKLKANSDKNWTRLSKEDARPGDSESKSASK